jgi:hypothetical protein
MGSEAGVVGESTERGEAEPPPAELLVNLTEHDVVLASRQVREGTDAQASVCIPPDGRYARVDDGAARQRDYLLDTRSGVVRVTRLSRSRRLVDLPPPRPRTRYVVSRVTALAARDRADLVFPFGEIRDEAGRVAGARGLASFQPRVAVWRRLGERRAPARDRRRGQPLSRQWLTGVLFAVATALLSATLSLVPGVLDSARANGWGAAWATWTLRLTAGFAVAGLVVLVVAARRWHERGVMLEERGTAYVIEEEAITWWHEEKASVLAEVGSGFAAVLRVPGPGEFGDDWFWQADAATAPQWDRRVDQLVSSFWAVHYNDDQVTRNAVFIWAPWPVAMAFGARVTARRRGLVLHVRQRPSHGAAGPHHRLPLTGAACDFRRHEGLPSLEDTAPGHVRAVACARVTLTITPLGIPHQGRPGAGHPAGGRRRTDGQDSADGLLLLVVRVSHGPIGPIPLELATTPPFTIRVSPSLAEHVIPAGTRTVPVAEWRLDPREPGRDRVPDLPWQAFPAAAEAIAGWITRQAAEHAARVVLLATRIPQELAVGLGVQLGQRSSEREPRQQWPQRVYPVFYTGDKLVPDADRLVVPDLRLGAGSVPSHRL